MISHDPNQSSWVPRSSISWSAETATAISSQPGRSILRGRRGVAGSSANSASAQAIPIGTLTKNTQRQLKLSVR